MSYLLLVVRDLFHRQEPKTLFSGLQNQQIFDLRHFTFALDFPALKHRRRDGGRGKISKLIFSPEHRRG